MFCLGIIRPRFEKLFFIYTESSNYNIIYTSLPDAVENRNGNRTCPFLLYNSKSRHIGYYYPDYVDLYNSYHYAQTMFGFSLNENTPQSPAQSAQQAANYRKLRGQRYNENRQRILTCIFGITTRLYGIAFNLSCFPQNTK